MDKNVKQLKLAIKKEYAVCVKDPQYFMKKYCVIQHPTKGKLKFDLYPFQKDVLNQFKNNRYNVVLKARQLGLSTLTAAYSLWTILFQHDKNILCIATGKDTAKNLVTKVRVMYQNLPSWLKTKVEEDNKLSMRLANGSQIKAVASNESAGRSEALSLLILDEAAFIDKIDEIWTAAQQTLATGGDCIMISTPNGVGNFFHQTWVGAQEKSNDFNDIYLHWSLHPDRDQTWRDEQDTNLGPKRAAQECDADFLTSGNNVIDPLILEWYTKTHKADPSDSVGIDNNLWIWEYPNYEKDYIVVADVARGDGTDYSAAQVIELEDITQVAEYKGQLGTTDYGNFLIELATKYNDALLVVENNNIGWACIQTIIDRGYKNLFYQSKDLKFVDTEHQIRNKYRAEDRNLVPGFATTSKTRPLIIAKLEEYVRQKLVTIKSSRLIDELFVFIYNNNKPQAMQGYNDDLVMSFAIALWIRDTALRFNKDRDNLQRSVMDSMLNLNGGFADGFSSGNNRPQNNPYKINIKGEEEDLTWLLG